MNQLNASLQHSIATLAANGWSARKSARELGLHRESVGRYLRPPEPDSKPAIVPTGSRAGRTSQCAPLTALIEQGLLAGLSAQRSYQDLVAGHGFTGGYDAVRRFVRRLARKVELPFRRLECAAGQELQEDFGQGAWVVENGKRRRAHLFRGVLSHSRKAYSEAVWRQTSESFIRCLENAFRHFGGVTATVVIDNLKAGVLQADWFDPALNPKLEEFARHYGPVILPTQPAMPRHKGKVEAGVKYAQNNAVKSRCFESLAAQNLFLSEWEQMVADTRIHGTTRQQVGKLFETVERPALQPLPNRLFPVFEEAPRTVHRDGYVEFQRAYYSAPSEYVGRQVWERQESRLLRIYNTRREPIALHALAEPGKFTTDPAHLHSRKRQIIERGVDYLLDRCRLIGPLAQALGYEAIKQGKEGLYRSIFDLVRDFLKDEAFKQQDKTLRRYLKPDLVIIDDMGLKALPKQSGEYLLEVVMRRYENRSTIMTSNRPLEDWGKLLSDVPTAGAILDRFLHHAIAIPITGRSYRIKDSLPTPAETKKAKKSNEPSTAAPAS